MTVPIPINMSKASIYGGANCFWRRCAQLILGEGSFVIVNKSSMKKERRYIKLTHSRTFATTATTCYIIIHQTRQNNEKDGDKIVSFFH